MFGARNGYISVANRFNRFQRRHFWGSTVNTTAQNGKGAHDATGSGNAVGRVGGGDIRDLEAYRDLDKLDFMKAAKILFTSPPKKKKFGIDFHLVQLFFACMPSLAVYLVAQYARYEMRKMEADLELKKKAEEEAKEKEMEANAAKEKQSNPELLKVKERLQALEETVKEIVIDKKKPKGDNNNSGNITFRAAKDQTSRSDQRVSQSVNANEKESEAQKGVLQSVKANAKEGEAQNGVFHKDVKK